MKYKKILWTILICVLTLLAGGLCLFVIVTSGKEPEDVFRVPEIGIVIISFIITLVGFVISMLTFFVIDTLQSVTSMDGNVLENENYSIAYEEVVDRFAQCDTKEKFTKELFDSVMPKRRMKSCMKFADELQNIVDYLIWFAYVDFKDEDVRKKCNKICKIIKKKKRHFDKLSNGINHVLNEYVKLIEYVLKYQENRKVEGTQCFSKLENVRGEMLKNPVAKIVYYDYLGLHYRRKAAVVIKTCGESGKEFSAEYMKAVKKYSYTEKQIDEYYCLISRSEKCFNKAQELSQNNVLWSGYISYNLMRIDVMNHLLMKMPYYHQVMQQMDRVIKIRKDMWFLLKREGAYLDKQLEQEIKLVTDMKKEFINI